MNIKQTKKKLLLPILIGLLFVPLFAFAKQAFDYVPMEEIPGFGRPRSYEEYILAIYKFGLWTVGISAVFMISIGAFTYITSGGNASTNKKAKEIVFDAIAGVILALVSYLILNTINPALLGIKGLEDLIDEANRSYDGTAYPTINADLPKDCSSEEWQAIFSAVSASSGIDACLLEAVTAKESSCNKNVVRTNGGQDCGVMQTRASNCPGSPSCAELEQNPTKAVECGAHYLKNNSDGRRRTDPTGDQEILDYYAGYNGGPGALAPSNSCSGTQVNQYGNSYKKWDCKKDCRGYCVMPGRTATVLNFYKKCKAR